MLSMVQEKRGRRTSGASRGLDGDFARYPEISTTPYWRGLMREARAQGGLNQGQLAAKLGTTQPTISDIETGEISQSKLVTPICDALGIPLPYEPVEDAMERRWIEAGRLLRHRRGDVFIQQLENIESLVKLLSGPDNESGDEDAEGRGH